MLGLLLRNICLLVNSHLTSLFTNMQLLLDLVMVHFLFLTFSFLFILVSLPININSLAYFHLFVHFNCKLNHLCQTNRTKHIFPFSLLFHFQRASKQNRISSKKFYDRKIRQKSSQFSQAHFPHKFHAMVVLFRQYIRTIEIQPQKNSVLQQ